MGSAECAGLPRMHRMMGGRADATVECPCLSEEEEKRKRKARAPKNAFERKVVRCGLQSRGHLQHGQKKRANSANQERHSNSKRPDSLRLQPRCRRSPPVAGPFPTRESSTSSHTSSSSVCLLQSPTDVAADSPVG